MAVATFAGLYVAKETFDAKGGLDIVALVNKKISEIIAIKPPIGNITPTRDLAGSTWVSSLQGKGFQLYGDFSQDGAAVSVYEYGDIELVIESVDGNTGHGKIRYSNMRSIAETSAAGQKFSSGEIAGPDSGYQPLDMQISGTRIDFGLLNTGEITCTMVGNYTTDIMTGTMTATTPYGVIKGEFNLMRRK
jgi:hypothetical protein